MAAITLKNGSAEHRKIVQAIEEAMNEDAGHWTKSMTAALVLDLITIACIVWLLLR